MIQNSLFALLLCAALLITGCSEGSPPVYQPQYGDQPPTVSAKQEYRFGVHPLHNPSRLFEVYGPLMDQLNAQIPEAHFTLEASRNYQEYDKKLYARHFDLALPNPYQTLNALSHGYHVFGKMGDDAVFRGLFIVRRDSGIHAVSDLKGKAVSFPAKTALAATMLPQSYLHTHGLPISAYQSRYVGSQESSIMNAYLGKTAAGATWPPPWIEFQKNHPDYAAQLQVQWQTEPMINNGLVARDDFPPDLLQKVGDLLFSLHTHPEGQEILARLPLSQFEAATDQTYQPIRDFVVRFSQTVRPLEE